ncbi:3'(2'),5'-bisphosphate nucleotidase CysQ [uncultured Ferrimonas sp.]|uniref:3'(2'),5'-bisphosphate nucleotidase CysQ n=1 Tax=uncultured Ferrimonas sp. TaxID=432640 RepID=UPI00262D4A24|nr:3'(2'),5'-bisphosphate nucleotidase CysQ [uncultured Ferrimonas sp.]
MSRLQSLLEPVIAIATTAGTKILEIYENGQFEELTKSDNTPVTSADLAAHQYIIHALAALAPEIPILSEEDADIPFAQRRNWQRYWLIDPLDGTQEFIAGSGDFAVNIALIEEGVPIMGVIYAPVSKVCYFATRGHGAFKRVNDHTVAIHSRSVAADENLKIAVSRRQRRESILARLNDHWNYDLVPFGSASLKSCMVAEGEADCYLRLGPTGEWDTGASQCVVAEAGGVIVDTLYQPLSYNERESLENPNYMVLGSQQLPWRDILPPA